MGTDSDHAASASHRAQANFTAPAIQITGYMHNDPRLLAGAGVVAGHAAQGAGFDERVQQNLATATEEACGEMFGLVDPNLKPAPIVNLTASRFSDRVEIILELANAAMLPKPASHAKRAVGHGGKHAGKLVDDRLVDHVQRETRDGRTSITLVKYFRPVKAKG